MLDLSDLTDVALLPGYIVGDCLFSKSLQQGHKSFEYSPLGLPPDDKLFLGFKQVK